MNKTKNLRSRILPLLFVPALAAFGQEPGDYRVEGKVADATFSGVIYMTDALTRDTLGSAEVKQGKYVFTGRVEKPRYALVFSRETRSGGAFILEPGQIVLQGTRQATGTGTPMNDEFQAFNRALLEIEAALRENRKSGEAARAEIVSLAGGMMAKHPDDVLGVLAVIRTVGLLDDAALLDLIEKAGSFVQQQEPVARKKKALLARIATAEGKKFTDFSAEYEGKRQSLSDYVGKGQYVLADFWASWCGPCRREIPHIAAVYNKYKAEGLVVLGVATWDKPADTQKAMKELDITWPQIMNAQYAGSDAYGIEGIPQIILFGPDGTILKRDLRGEEMVRTIDEIMSQSK